MKKIPVHSLLLAGFLSVYTLVALAGISAVPFHPDESTQIYMSSDLGDFFRSPSSLFWQPQKTGDLHQHYREMDAPLTRDLIGLGRLVAGLPAQTADWDWSLSWQANQAAGALPGPASLLVSRLAVAWLLPLSLLLVYRIGRALGGTLAAWVAGLLFALNPLVLLHARRAMAESALLFAGLLAVYGMLRWRKHPWLLALPLALAVSAKHSAAILALPLLAALLWQPVTWKARLRGLLCFALLFALLSLALNPFLWAHPFAAALSAAQARIDFTAQQAALLTSLGSDLAGENLPARLAGELVQVFLAPPAVADVSNYLANTRAAAAAYLSNPLNNLPRGLVAGGVCLGLSLAGLALGLRRAFSPTSKNPENRRGLLLLALATLSQFLALGGLVAVPFQRYYIGMLPLACIWIGYALSESARLLTKNRERALPVGSEN